MPDYRQKIISKAVDIGIFIRSFNEDTIRSTHIFVMPISIIVRADHSIYKHRTNFTVEDFFSVGFVALEDELRKSIQFNQESLAMGRTRPVKSKVKRVWSLLNTAAQTDMAAAVPTYMAHMYKDKLDIRIFDLPINSPPDNCYMGWHEDYEGDPTHQWLRDTTLDILKDFQRVATKSG